MTWSTISCFVLSLASLSLLIAAAPAWLRKAAAGGASWVAAVVLASGLVLQLQSPATAQSAAPVVVVWAVGADGDTLEPPLEVIQDAVAEAVAAEALESPAEALDAPVAAAAADVPADPADPPSAPVESPLQADGQQLTPGGQRVVELPEDFAAPGKQTVFIPTRPQWVDRAPQMVDDDFCVSVSSAFQVQKRDTRASLDDRLQQAVNEYIREYLRDDKATYFIHYPIQDIRSRMVAKDPESAEFQDLVETSMASLHQSHALLRFTPELRAELDQKWTKIRQTGRVVGTAGAGIGVLIVLSLMFGYFRLDTATKGYYTRRLQMVLVAAILAVLAVGIVYFRSAGDLIHRLM